MELDAYIQRQVEQTREWRQLVGLADAARPDGEACDTVREILQQPWVWKRSARKVVDAGLLSEGWVRPGEPIWLSGAGSSVLVGRSVDRMLQRRLGRPCCSVPTTDLVLSADSYFNSASRGWMVSFSRSGASAESFEAIEAVRRTAPSVRHLLVTCNPQGRLIQQFEGAEFFSSVALHPATCDRGLAMTSSFSSMVVAAQGLAWAGEADAYLHMVDSQSALAETILEQAAVIASEVSRSKPERICFLGSGVREGAAHEAALKVMEMTDGTIPTLAESYLGLRHGPMSFLQERTAIIYFLSSDPRTRAYELDLLAEVRDKQLGSIRVAIGHASPECEGCVDHWVRIPDSAGVLADELLPPLDILVPQTLALSLSLSRGLNPDNPSPRGVINRIAQGVKPH